MRHPAGSARMEVGAMGLSSARPSVGGRGPAAPLVLSPPLKALVTNWLGHQARTRGCPCLAAVRTLVHGLFFLSPVTSQWQRALAET